VVQATQGVEEGRELVLDLVIGEAKDPVAESLEVRIPIDVMPDLAFFCMNAAVDLQDKPHLVAEEVGDVGSHGSLPAEFQAEETAVPHMIPKHLLGLGGGAPELLRAKHGTRIGNPHRKSIPQA